MVTFFFAVLHSLSLSLSGFIFALSETLCTIAQFVVVAVVVVYLTQNSFVVCRVCAEFLFLTKQKSNYDLQIDIYVEYMFCMCTCTCVFCLFVFVSSTAAL